MKITKEELLKIVEFEKEEIARGFYNRDGRFYMRPPQKTNLDFDGICNNLDYLEKLIEREKNEFVKFKYTMAISVLLDLLEEGKYDKRE